MRTALPQRSDGIAPRQTRRPGALSTGSDRFDTLIGCLALVALVASSLYGTLAAAVFILAALSFAVIHPLASGRDLIRFSPLLILPLLAMLSTIWSDAPERTIRAALQLFITLIAAIFLCRRLEARTVFLALFLSLLGCCLLAVPSIPHSLSTGFPLRGPFASKNALSFVAHSLVGFALAVMLDPQQPRLARFGALAGFPLGIVLLVLSRSAGAQVATAITLMLFPALLLFGRFKMPTRIAVLIGLAVIVAAAIIVLPDLLAAWGDFRQNVLKKDGTLTGRTYLWDVAEQLNADHRLLGRGYYAFWRQGNIDAEGLWRWGGVPGRSGFNFHNAFVEMTVDLGLVGLAVFVATCVGVALASAFRQLTRPSVSSAFFLTYLVVVYIRSYAESGLIGPFSLTSLLWIASAVYAFAPAGLGQHLAPPARTPRFAAPLLRRA